MQRHKQHVYFLYSDQDGAEPSPNSLSAHNLRRLSAYCPDRRIDISSANIFEVFREMMSSHPVALPEMLSAFVFHSQAPKQVREDQGKCVHCKHFIEVKHRCCFGSMSWELGLPLVVGWVWTIANNIQVYVHY